MEFRLGRLWFFCMNWGTETCHNTSALKGGYCVIKSALSITLWLLSAVYEPLHCFWTFAFVCPPCPARTPACYWRQSALSLCIWFIFVWSLSVCFPERSLSLVPLSGSFLPVHSVKVNLLLNPSIWRLNRLSTNQPCRPFDLRLVWSLHRVLTNVCSNAPSSLIYLHCASVKMC